MQCQLMSVFTKSKNLGNVKRSAILKQKIDDTILYICSSDQHHALAGTIGKVTCKFKQISNGNIRRRKHLYCCEVKKKWEAA